MQPSKKQSLLYSLWMIPVLFAGLICLLMLINVRWGQQWTYESFQLISPFVFIGYLFAAVTSKQKKDWAVLFIFIAVFFMIIAIANAFGLNNVERGNAIGSILYLVYVAAGCIFAFFYRRRIIAGAVYARSDEFKAQRDAEKAKSFQRDLQGVRGQGKTKAASAAPAGTALTGAFTKGPASPANARPAAPAYAKPAAQPAAPAYAKPAPQPAAPVNANMVRHETDVNTCGIEELMSLPGVSLADAKRAIQERETNGGFTSVEDFIRRSGWKPHLVARFIDDLKVSQIHEESSQKRRGRSLDL